MQKEVKTNLKINTTKEQERAELHRAIWQIANDLRGSVDGWDFKQYVLGMLFYRFISENLTNYINADERRAGNKDFDYEKLSDKEAEYGRVDTVKEKGFYILPSELFVNVVKNARQDSNLNEILAQIFKNIEASAKGTESEVDLNGLFNDLDGRLEHREFLITDPKGDLTRPLVERMKADIDPNGTVISWCSSYEKQRNEKLAELHPDFAGFLENLNDGMFDLMEIFAKQHYVHPAFKGSASIKKVLPVLVPELTYKNLNISKGDQASERWERMISKDTPLIEKEQIKKDLLEYCKMDTWAMVKIYQFLKKVVSEQIPAYA